MNKASLNRDVIDYIAKFADLHTLSILIETDFENTKEQLYNEFNNRLSKNNIIFYKKNNYKEYLFTFMNKEKTNTYAVYDYFDGVSNIDSDTFENYTISKVDVNIFLKMLNMYNDGINRNIYDFTNDLSFIKKGDINYQYIDSYLRSWFIYRRDLDHLINGLNNITILKGGRRRKSKIQEVKVKDKVQSKVQDKVQDKVKDKVKNKK